MTLFVSMYRINIMLALNNSVPYNAVSMVTDIYISFVLGMIIRMK